MRTTTAFEKLMASIINVIVVFVFYTPVIFLNLSILQKKIIFILLFLLYNIAVIFLSKNRCIGMILTNAFWKEDYPIKNQMIYAVLYTLSFVTMLFWIAFPGDLLLANILLVQLPFVIRTGTTFHGHFSGHMTTITNTESKINRYNKLFYILSYLFFCGILPLLMLQYDFGFTTFDNNDFAFVAIKVYATVFLFGIIAGFLLPYFLYPPIILLLKNRGKKKMLAVVTTSFLIALSVSVLDFYFGNQALWETKKSVHNRKIHMPITGEMKTLEEFFIQPSDSLAKQGFEKEINRVTKSLDYTLWSNSRVVYFFNLLIQSFTMFLFLFVSTIFFARKSQLIELNHYKESVINLICTGLIIFTWYVLKLACDYEKTALYPNLDLEISNFIIPSLLTIGLLFSALSYYLKFHELLKPLITVLPALGISGFSFYGLNNKEYITRWFGRNANLGTYITILISFVILTVLFRIISEESESEGSKKQDQPSF